MATESLIVELDAKTGAFVAKMKAAGDETDGLGKKSKKTDSSLAKMGKTLKVAGGAAAGAVTAFLAINAAITAMVLSSANVSGNT